jgi:hypothetical protein
LLRPVLRGPARVALGVGIAAGCGAEGAPADEVASPTADTALEAPKPDDTGAPKGCEATVAWLEPAAGARHVDPDLPLTVGFKQPVQNTDWWLKLDGAPVAAELAADGLSATGRPPEPLSRGRTYELAAAACDSERSGSFTTLGLPIDARALADHPFVLDPRVFAWSQPGVAAVLQPLFALARVELVVGPDPRVQGGARAQLVATPLGPPGTYAACPETVDLGPLDASRNPRFATPLTEVGAAGQAVGEAALSFVSLPGAVALEDLRVRGIVDVRALPVPPGACALAAAAGSPCMPCDDGASACLNLELRASRAEASPTEAAATARACDDDD